MTDKEIKRALDEAELFLQKRVKDGQPIKLSEYDVGKLRNISQTCAKAYDEIDQLQTENENLKVENQSLRSAANSLKMHYEEARAEIERLKQRNAVYEAANRCIVWQRDRRDREIEELHSQIAGLNIYKSKIKAEAYKECLAKVKNYIKTHCNPYGKPDFDYDTSIKILNFIDNLVKEMVGENNE